ncbi:MAG: hypothetical protein HOW73_17035 [Polyangiaceae bacterium]|nr:hypothetical protein [Polyangiaceae bacterium]
MSKTKERASIVAQHDPGLAPRITARRPLFYERGADPIEDRPRHVRAASSVVRFLGTLFVVQDDALFLARIDESTFRVADVLLPRGPGALRLFDDVRGNKADKLDLEAAAVVPSSEGEVLLAFGSGSTPVRERIVVLRPRGDSLDVRIADGAALYAQMRADRSFSGSELNIEGALLDGRDLLFFQRGNGKAVDDLKPVDATARVDAAELLAHLEGRGPCPSPHEIARYELGSIGGCRLTFTDASWYRGSAVYVAAAEASPDAITDGPVAGVAIGTLGGPGAVRYGLLRDERGELSCDKVEGIVEAAGGGLIGVIDRDDPDAPAELVHIDCDIA